MKFINRPRRTGITTMLIATAYITGYPIIVVNENFARCIKDQARKTGYNIEVYTVSEWRNIFACGAPRENVLIDEADGVIELALENLLRCKVAACTLTLPMTDVTEKEEVNK